jgi:circadian clock protein KaiB
MENQPLNENKPTWHFRLYVAGDSPHSLTARANLEGILGRLPEGEYQVEIVDILKQPLRMFEDGVIVTPTLIKLSPQPGCQLMGSLSDTLRVLQALEISEAQNE